MQSVEAMNGLVFFKVLAHAVPKGNRVFQQYKVWSSEEALSIMLPAAALQTYPGVVCRLVFIALVKWRMWLNTNDLATHCAGLLIPKWACM